MPEVRRGDTRIGQLIVGVEADYLLPHFSGLIITPVFVVIECRVNHHSIFGGGKHCDAVVGRVKNHHVPAAQFFQGRRIDKQPFPLAGAAEDIEKIPVSVISEHSSPPLIQD